MVIKKMKINILKIIKIVLIILAVVAIGIVGFVAIGLRGIPESHIEENVPDKNVFNQYLSRDLTFYFSKQNNKDVKIQYSLLRDNPTQVGVSTPKFYLWVKIIDFKNNNLLDQGAVVVGANNKESFTIMDFVSKKEININPETLNSVFPEDVVLKIKQLL